jgi:hypothetical protein
LKKLEERGEDNLLRQSQEKEERRL